MKWMSWAALLVMPAMAQVTVPDALATAKKDLATALEQLETVRSEISKEKPALAGEFETVEQELAEKRRLVRIARTAVEDRERAMRQLERERTVRGQDAGFLAGLLKDQALKVATLSGPGEPSLAVDAELLARDAEDVSMALTERLGVLDASLDRLEALMGGSTAAGRAATAEGEVLEGTFAAAGPLAWFEGGGQGGPVLWERGESLPKLSGRDEVGPLFRGAEAELGLDVTGGKARALEEVGGGPVDLVRKGGLWVWPILILALISLVLGILKVVQFSAYREPGEAWVTAILAALRVGDRGKAAELAGKPKHPAAAVMARLVELSGNTADVVEETLYEQLMGVQSKATALLPVIAVTAATAPLLGLLGTVSGMIRTFNLITVFGSGDPKPLAGGISEALITTLFGLVVAIPALILHAFLSRRSQGIVQSTERLGLTFVNAQRAK
ncbi:biopolymer transport protein ExbB [Haloferula luteola]|uniref:Biopolymer transport protein ExbB n=1 Tax=Haloferula luteola TaxID=595692 RepID=A0A840V4A9_9BACT|nr:MotA/TolQ/ExbB proton channel family protein [Haloferula luteola]MBB5352822.1 biopolymer transport protein ExbB [Haloferula luteola]